MLFGKFEDVSFPSALFQAAQVAFPFLLGKDFGGGLGGKFERATLDLSQLKPYSTDGALNHSLIYLVTGFDNAKGQIALQTSVMAPDGQPVIAWPGAGAQPIFETINTSCRRARRRSRRDSLKIRRGPPWG